MRMDLREFERQTRLMERRQRTFGEARDLYGCAFDRDSGGVPQMEQARQYVAHWEETRRQGLGLLFSGRPGNGKTFTAACIANALVERGLDVRMTTLGEALSRLPALSAGEKLRYLGELKRCDLLILDDFGMERQTDYAQEQVFSIVDGRYLSRRPMIVTTNLNLRTLRDAEDLMERRIYDRVLERCVPVRFDQESLRREKGLENVRLYKRLTKK